MMRAFTIGLSGAACLAVAACSGSGAMLDYVNMPAVIVDIGCNETYDVFDRPNAGTLLVRTNAGAEAVNLVCRSGPAGEARAGRYQRVAERHFENTKRPLCRVLEIRTISPLHAEVVYSCRRP